MFLVCTGALTSIPDDLKEAASIDGASGFAGFRRVTFPSCWSRSRPCWCRRSSFQLQQPPTRSTLLTEGGPFTPDNPTAGGTDILISYILRLGVRRRGRPDRVRLRGVGRPVRPDRRHRRHPVPRHPCPRGCELTCRSPSPAARPPHRRPSGRSTSRARAPAPRSRRPAPSRPASTGYRHALVPGDRVAPRRRRRRRPLGDLPDPLHHLRGAEPARHRGLHDHHPAPVLHRELLLHHPVDRVRAGRSTRSSSAPS